jgi:hypothetical protein
MSEPQPDAQRDVPMVAMTAAIVAALDRLIQQARTRRRVPMLVTNENGALEMADVVIEKMLAEAAGK